MTLLVSVFIDRIVIEDVFITSELGAELVESENIELKNVTLHVAKGEALILKNCKKVNIEKFTGSVASSMPVVAIGGKNTDEISLKSSSLNESDIHMGAEVKKGVVKQ